jgi:hypothetical protein
VSEEREKRMNQDQLTTADLAGAHGKPPAHPDRRISQVLREGQPERRNPGQARNQAAAAAATATALVPSPAPAKAQEEEPGPLFSSEEASDLRSKWDAIQVGFVDEPRRSVERADTLVAAAMKRLAEQFAAERAALEKQWSGGGDVSTEDLRLALRRYRSFFGRLLAV